MAVTEAGSTASTHNSGSQILLAEAGQSRAAALSSHLQRSIIAGEFRLGDPLPSERDLMTTYDVSRATVREALRALGAQGLIEVRRGRNGGSYVCGPSSRTFQVSLDLFISGHTIKFRHLTAVREAIEPIAAREAAINRTEEDIHILYDLTRSGEQHVGDITKFSDINLDWHMAIVRASQNPLFVGFMTSIASALYTATNRKEFDLPTRKLVVAAHWKTFQAIRDQDPDAALRRMGRHVSAYGQRLSVDK